MATPIPVTTSVPDTSIYDDQGARDDLWMFAYALVYMMKRPDHPGGGQPTDRLMKIVQVHKHSKQPRYIQIDPKADSMGRIEEIVVTEVENDAPPHAFTVIRLHPYVYCSRDVVTRKMELFLGELRHWELMDILRRDQAILLPGTMEDMTRFYVNFAVRLEKLHITREGGGGMLSVIGRFESHSPVPPFHTFDPTLQDPVIVWCP
jgi:hypothetical protein